MVIDRVQRFLADDSATHTATGRQDAREIETRLQNARAASVTLTKDVGACQRAVLQHLVERIDLHDDHIDIAVRVSVLAP